MFVGAVALMMMNTEPIRVDAIRPAMAVESTPDFAEAVALAIPMKPGGWRHIVVHSHADNGEDAMARCHFVIDVIRQDGADTVRIRPTELWTQQRPGRHANVAGHDYNSDGIGISLAGDFDLHAPTPTQMNALTELVAKLQRTCGIDRDRVFLYHELSRTAQPGTKFPAGEFHDKVVRLDR